MFCWLQWPMLYLCELTMLPNPFKEFYSLKINDFLPSRCLFLVLEIAWMQYGFGFVHFVPSLPPRIPPFSLPPLRVAPGCSPLCDGSSNSGKRSAGISGQHTGPSGARNVRSGAYKATGRGAHLSEIIRCLCLPGLWQVDRLCLRRRPSESHREPLSGSSDTQTHIAATDISAKWIEQFACLLNVRKYQSTFLCEFDHLAWPSLFFSLTVAPVYSQSANRVLFIGLLIGTKVLDQYLRTRRGEDVSNSSSALNLDSSIVHVI